MMEPYAFKVCMDRADLKFDQNNQKPHWIEWLAHTNFSFLHGASHPSELLDAAMSYGYSGLGICDFDGAYGLARTYRHWKNLDAQKRPKLFYGAEIHLSIVNVW